MVDGEEGRRPSFPGLVENALQRPLGERLVRFVHEMQDPPALVVIADDAQERRDAADVGRGDGLNQRRQNKWLRGNGGW